MRDAMDARIWADHHETFSASLDRLVASAAARVGRLMAGPGVGRAVIVIFAAAMMSTVTLGGAVA